MNVPAIEDLCNGSTPDSDSVCGGSNPSSSAKKCRYPFGYLHFLLCGRGGIRTDLNARLRWSLACRRSRRRQHHSLIETLIRLLKQRLNKHETTHLCQSGNGWLLHLLPINVLLTNMCVIIWPCFCFLPMVNFKHI